MFESAISIVLVIFAIIFIGYLFAYKGWLGANASTVLSRMTLRIGMPALILSNMLTSYTRQMLLDGAYSLLVPLGVLGGLYLLSGPLARWLRVGEGRVGVFRALFTFGNTVFVGMPVCRALFGEDAVPFVLLYYLVNTVLWWLVGAPFVARDGGKDTHGLMKRLASPPLIACFVSLALILLDFRPPEILLTLTGYLGAMVTPISLLFIGVTLCPMLAQGIRWQRSYGAVLLGRFALGPLLCLPLCLLLGISGNQLGVFFLQSGMPAQTQTCLWAQEHGADAGYAAGAITLSTLLSIVSIPLYAWLFSVL